MPKVNQVKSFKDNVTANEYMQVIAAINELYDTIAVLNNDNAILKQRSNSFLATAGSGLSVSIAGGIIKRISDGLLINVATQTAYIPPGSTNLLLFLDRNGVIQNGSILPSESYEVCRVSSNATQITGIEDLRSPSFEIKQRQLRRIIQANKTGVQALSSNTLTTLGGLYTSESWQYNEGGILAGSGVFTVPKTAYYNVTARVQLQSNTPTNLSAKMSLYIGNTELRVLAEQQVNVNALSCILYGSHGDILNQGSTATIRLQIGSGSGVYIPDNLNTELIISVIG